MPTTATQMRGHPPSPPSEVLAAVERLGRTQQRLSRRLVRVLLGTAAVLLLNVAAILYSGGHLTLWHAAAAGANSAPAHTLR